MCIQRPHEIISSAIDKCFSAIIENTLMRVETITILTNLKQDLISIMMNKGRIHREIGIF